MNTPHARSRTRTRLFAAALAGFGWAGPALAQSFGNRPTTPPGPLPPGYLVNVAPQTGAMPTVPLAPAGGAMMPMYGTPTSPANPMQRTAGQTPYVPQTYAAIAQLPGEPPVASYTPAPTPMANVPVVGGTAGWPQQVAVPSPAEPPKSGLARWSSSIVGPRATPSAVPVGTATPLPSDPSRVQLQLNRPVTGYTPPPPAAVKLLPPPTPTVAKPAGDSPNWRWHGYGAVSSQSPTPTYPAPMMPPPPPPAQEQGAFVPFDGPAIAATPPAPPVNDGWRSPGSTPAPTAAARTSQYGPELAWNAPGGAKPRPPAATDAPVGGFLAAPSPLVRPYRVPTPAPTPIPSAVRPVEFQSPAEPAAQPWTRPQPQPQPTAAPLAGSRWGGYGAVPGAEPVAASRVREVPVAFVEEQAPTMPPLPGPDAERYTAVQASRRPIVPMEPPLPPITNPMTNRALLSPLHPAVERACSELGYDLEVLPRGTTALTVRVKVRKSADAEPLANRISKVPELAAYQIVFEMRIVP